MTAYEIKVAFDHTEGQEFVDWLNENGHTAEMSDDSGNYVDGVWTSTDEDANQIMNKLWSDYCNS